MTTSMFDAHVEEMASLRAERKLDAADASHPTPAWYDAQITTIKRAAGEAVSDEPKAPTPFRLKLRDPHGTGNYHGLISPRQLHARVLGLQDKMYG